MIKIFQIFNKSSALYVIIIMPIVKPWMCLGFSFWINWMNQPLTPFHFHILPIIIRQQTLLADCCCWSREQERLVPGHSAMPAAGRSRAPPRSWQRSAGPPPSWAAGRWGPNKTLRWAERTKKVTDMVIKKWGGHLVFGRFAGTRKTQPSAMGSWNGLDFSLKREYISPRIHTPMQGGSAQCCQCRGPNQRQRLFQEETGRPRRTLKM